MEQYNTKLNKVQNISAIDPEGEEIAPPEEENVLHNTNQAILDKESTSNLKSSDDQINLLLDCEDVCSNLNNKQDLETASSNKDTMNHFFPYNNDDDSKKSHMPDNEESKVLPNNLYNNFNDCLNIPSVSSSNTLANSETHSLLDDPVNCNTEILGQFHGIPCTDKASDMKNEKNLNIPPKYQNILLPVKLDSLITDKSNFSNESESNISVNTDLNISGLKAENISKEINLNTSEDNLEHKYENVYIGSDISKKLDIDFPKNLSKSTDIEHSYENLKFKSYGNDGASECTYNESLKLYQGAELKKLTNQIDNINKLDTESTNVTTRLVFQNVQLANPRPPVETKPSTITFNIIDDMSEEELNQYLADLEAEELLKEEASAAYQNFNIVTTNVKSKAQNQVVDEDANEAPIFEAVTIGELPKVPKEELKEKAKKFPIIDYSKSSASNETSKDVSKLQLETSKVFTEIKEEIKKEKNKKINENVMKSSENTNIKRAITDTDAAVCSDDTESFKTFENVNSLICEKEDDNFLEQNEKLLNENKTSLNEGRPAEIVSRFSVATNVDINDKLGSRFKPIERAAESGLKNINEVANKPIRPQTLDVTSTVDVLENFSAEVDNDRNSCRVSSPDASENSSLGSEMLLGKQPPFWVPDSDAPNCMLCNMKFTVMKRRHHCRACGKVLCSKCCNMKYRLEYQGNVDSRVCISCYQLLTKAESESGSEDWLGYPHSSSNSGVNPSQDKKKPDPHNPMEYCSTIPPLQQFAGNLPPPPTVMVPVGVLKREGSTKQRHDGPKSVIFSDELDTTWDWKFLSTRKASSKSTSLCSSIREQDYPSVDNITKCYVPHEMGALPPTVTIQKGQITYHEVTDQNTLYSSLSNECEPPVIFAVNHNLYAYVKIINFNCCVNKICWNVTSKGLAYIGQDEVVFLVETLPDEKEVPKDLLIHINQIYQEACKGNTISELDMTVHHGGNLLGSREHTGFLFIRQTLQCLQKVILPVSPFLFGLLVHRWETPWAKVFPLRLVLRLGAEYRYYPSPLFSVRFRDAVYFEIGHTIMKVLADFRNYAYSLPKVQGLTILMQDRTTNVNFPKNRYNYVIKGLSNSNDHVIAFASNFSIQADSHLVCIQNNSEEESNYQTQAINIQNKPRKVTGASFIVINGALKPSMGLSAKSSILEDGLMVQIMPEKMEALKAALKNMQDFSIGCGHQGSAEPDEVVNIKWVENDTQFNLGVKSPIDGKPMDGIPSIRIHNGIKCLGTSRYIRWTEVFIIKSDDDQPFGIQCPVDINKLSESIAKATCIALVKLLDLLTTAGLTKIGVRTTIHPENVGYEAGSEGIRLPPLYMKSLDNELIKVLQKAVQGCEDTHTVLELIFYILETEKT